MDLQLSDRQRDILIWIMVGLGFLLIVGLVVFIAVIVSQNNRANNNSSGGGVKTVIYELDRRGLPTKANSATDLFPQTFGAFTRKAASGTIRGQAAGTFQASYARNKDAINIVGSRDNNYAQAEADMRNGVLQAGLASQIITLDTTFGYTLSTSNGEVHLIYFHGNWYWNITANSQTALDDFMKVFPY